MSLKLLVEAQQDRQSFERVADQAKDTFDRAGREAGQAFDRGLTSNAGNMRGTMQRIGRDTSDSFKTEFSRGINEAVSGAAGQFGTLGRAAESALGAIPTKAAVAAVGIAGITLAAVEVGKALYNVGAEWDSIADGITVRTGKIGSDLKQLTDVVGDVGRTTAASLGSIGDIVGQLQQTMPGLAENNTAIRDMASNLAYLDTNGQAINIRQLGMAFSAFNVSATDQVRTLDQLAHASQSTGIPINDLIASVQSGAPQFKQFGLDMGQATAMLTSFQQGGLNTDSALAGLRIALKNLGTDARGPQVALAETVAEIKRLHDAGQEAAAQDLAQQVFGGRNFAPFLDAIESGRVNVEGLKKAIDETGLSIKNMQDLTDDGAQAWQKLSNTIKTDLKPAADGVFGAMNANVQILTGHFGDLIDSITGVDGKLQAASEHMKELAETPITPDSALGKMLLPAGPLGGGGAGMPGPIGIGSGTGPAPPGSPLMSPNGLYAPQWGSTSISSPGGSSGSRAGLPQAPSLPYDTTLPAGFANLPQTSAIVSAENSWMDARHTLAEKQARLNQLENTNTASADDIQKARNDIVNAEQTQQQAELQLINARQELFDKYNKQMTGQLSSMSEFGAKLDSDFGISKGLAGIAENLTKFIGNLIAAPELAKLNAITEADPHKGGYGLMGMLGAQGAFGPQFTGIDYSKYGYGGSSALGPAGFGGGLVPPAGAAIPGESDRDFAHRVMMPFFQSQGLTVGDHAADKYGEHQHGAIDIMVKNLAEGQRVLQEVLSDPNVYGAIFNNQTYGYGHGLTPQPYGSTGSPTDRHEDHVHAWYKPGGSNNIVPGGGGAPQWSADWNAIAQGESGGNWGINTGNGFSGGLQFTPSSWAGAGGTQYAPNAWQATPYQQALTAEQLLAQQGPGAWPNTFVPGSSGPAPSGWGGPIGLPPGISGGGGQSPVWGANPAGPGLGGSATAGIPGVGYPGLGAVAGGPGLGPTRIGGIAGQQGFGKGGVGLSDGAMGAAMAAAGGLDLLAPGAGQAAQTGIKLANRAIQYGGQVAGIMTQGWMDTFLPFGGSQLASNNWITRIIGGLAGAAPAIPNVAGKSPGALTPDQAQAQQAQGAPAAKGDTNITNNFSGIRTDDTAGMMRDVEYHGQNMYAPAGTP